MNNQQKLLGMFDALISTVENASSNQAVFDDENGTTFQLIDIAKMRESLAALVNGKEPRFITWDKDNADTKQAAYDSGLYTINHGRNLAYWTEVADAFAEMPYGHTLNLETELFIEGDYA